MTSHLGSLHIRGSSGRTYRFRAFAIDAAFEHVGGVYFITSRNALQDGRVAHSRIYCGETSDLSSRVFSDSQAASFRSYGANCICVFLTEDALDRRNIERDIHSKYKLLYAG